MTIEATLDRIATAIEKQNELTVELLRRDVPAPTVQVVEAEAPAVDYEKMSLDALKEEAAKRGHEFPPRTKSTTMVKWLQENDEAQADLNATDETPDHNDNGGQNGPVVEKPEDEPREDDPFAEDPPEEDDPFAEDTQEDDPFAEPTEEPVTKEMAYDAIVEYNKANGQDATRNLLKKVAGVTKWTAVTDEHFPAIYKAAKE